MATYPSILPRKIPCSLVGYSPQGCKELAFLPRDKHLFISNLFQTKQNKAKPTLQLLDQRCNLWTWRVRGEKERMAPLPSLQPAGSMCRAGWPDCEAPTPASPTPAHPTSIPTIRPWQPPFPNSLPRPFQAAGSAPPGHSSTSLWVEGEEVGGGRTGRASPGLKRSSSLFQKTSHVQPRAPAPALAAGGPATAALQAATARHPRGQGHHHGLHPLLTGQSHILPEEEAARNQPGRCGGVPDAGRWVRSACPRLATEKAVLSLSPARSAPQDQPTFWSPNTML